MKITRALLLSSQKQAESWEHGTGGIFRWRTYRYLIDDQDENGRYRFRIFCAHQEPVEGTTRSRDVVAPDAHVDEMLSDTAALINFLRRHQIDFETAWQPVEIREK